MTSNKQLFHEERERSLAEVEKSIENIEGLIDEHFDTYKNCIDECFIGLFSFVENYKHDQNGN